MCVLSQEHIRNRSLLITVCHCVQIKRGTGRLQCMSPKNNATYTQARGRKEEFGGVFYIYKLLVSYLLEKQHGYRADHVICGIPPLNPSSLLNKAMTHLYIL